MQRFSDLVAAADVFTESVFAVLTANVEPAIKGSTEWRSAADQKKEKVQTKKHRETKL